MELPKHIEHDLLTMFEQSVGYIFRVKGTPIQDIVDGVDWKLKLVKGRKYGDFGVHLCELCGGIKVSPESLTSTVKTTKRMKLNYKDPLYLLALLVVCFFWYGTCQSNKVDKLKAQNESRIDKQRIQELQEQAANSEAKLKRLKDDRQKYTDSVKLAHKPVKVRLQSDLDTINILKRKLATRLQENPDINELVKAQDSAYSRLDSLYKGSELAHSAEIVNLESQLAESGRLVMIEAAQAEIWRQSAEAAQKDVRKEVRRKTGWKVVSGILASGLVIISIRE